MILTTCQPVNLTGILTVTPTCQSPSLPYREREGCLTDMSATPTPCQGYTLTGQNWHLKPMTKARLDLDSAITIGAMFSIYWPTHLDGTILDWITDRHLIPDWIGYDEPDHHHCDIMSTQGAKRAEGTLARKLNGRPKRTWHWRRTPTKPPSFTARRTDAPASPRTWDRASLSAPRPGCTSRLKAASQPRIPRSAPSWPSCWTPARYTCTG